MQETIDNLERNNTILKELNLAITDKLMNLEKAYEDKIAAYQAKLDQDY